METTVLAMLAFVTGEGALVRRRHRDPHVPARSPDAELCIRAGYVAPRRIADFFDVRHNPDPHWPEEPISIDRREFDQVCRQLAEAGVPLRPTPTRPWRDFAGWRVNDDRCCCRWPR